MFINKEFHCFTIPNIRQEFFRTQKFKEKYPWRNKYKDKIICLPSSYFNTDQPYKSFYQAIEVLIENNTINERTGRLFDLSNEDKSLAACALAKGFSLMSGDDELIDLLKQQFPKFFKGNISPLGMVNHLIRRKLIQWNDELHTYITDWSNKNEHPQPQKQKRSFNKLTGRRYPGS